MKSVKSISGRAHPLWFAYILHRLSGLGLALFLPLHFWVLAMAMTNPLKLDAFFNMSESTAIKAAEFILVFLLAVHMFGGLRLMAMEWLPWSHTQKSLAAVVVTVSFLIAILFLLQAL